MILHLFSVDTNITIAPAKYKHVYIYPQMGMLVVDVKHPDGWIMETYTVDSVVIEQENDT